MLKQIGVGTEVFHKLIEENKYYVDKTALIRTVFLENGADVLLITRPRRFGKTLTMSTFYDFLALNPENPGDVSRQENWFRDTEIFSDREFCRNYMGKFPVIFLTFKSVASSNFNDSYNQLAHVVWLLARNFSYLKSSSALDDEDRESFNNLLSIGHLKERSDKTDLTNALLTLTNLLYKHHKIEPVLLIDEYDVPIAKAARYGYYRDMVDVIAPFLSAGLKGNTNMKRAAVTGCLRAAKESIFTGLNNFLNCTVLDSGDDELSAGIGFTEEETNAALSYYGLAEYRDKVRQNYDGYNFGTVHMHCPWDVMSFCNDNYRKVGHPEKIILTDNYWINTSGNDVIEEFMGYIQPEDVDKMQDLLDGKRVTAEVRKALCYGDLSTHDINDFWTLLLYTGYLTFDPSVIERKDDAFLYQLFIPNQEIRSCFKSRIHGFFSRNPVMKNHAADFIKSLFSGNAAETQEHLSSLLAKYVSIRDFATNAPKENYYHGFINGLLINGVSLIQEQKSNFESGEGYIDLIIKSAGNKRIIVILELKQTEDENRDTVLIARSAIDQILDKKYADPYLERNDIDGVYAFGICFCKKSCSAAARTLK